MGGNVTYPVKVSSSEVSYGVLPAPALELAAFSALQLSRVHLRATNASTIQCKPAAMVERTIPTGVPGPVPTQKRMSMKKITTHSVIKTKIRTSASVGRNLAPFADGSGSTSLRA